ncbi:MAG TPA: N-acetyl-gamma-glutamyl-phosphate reductase [Candidatus Kryptonia bacterium]|nr:N-acetyl-gamma-glutamyl-phosphate reductase [Candidatus Kryptonia bacterium]
MARDISVGIVGGSGYSGGELLRLLLGHPRLRIAWVTSRGDKNLEAIHRNLVGNGLAFIKEEDAPPADAVILCMPSRESMTRAERYLKQGAKVVDVGSDFRLKDRALFEQVYKAQHTSWPLVEEAPYGATELHRERIRAARLVANPGCFAYTAILTLAPLVKEKLVELDRIVVDGMSGTSGAGAEPVVPTHHSEIGNSAFPYNVVDHRHTYEIEQELSGVAGAPVTIHFTPYYCPFTRGILANCHGFLKRAVSREELLALYQDFYRGEYFVRVLTFAKEPKVSWQYLPYPSVAEVAGSNFVHIGLDVDPRRGRVVAFGALDNLGKGAASSAIQNLNCMLGLPEEMGIEGVGLHP